MIGQTVGHYRVLEFLGHGESGAVYRAEDLIRHRLVALKILPAPHFREPATAERIESGLNAAARLDHPAIPRIYDLGKDDQFRYVAMQLVEGTSLDARLRKGPLAPEEAVSIAWEVASALETAHAAGLPHGDLKPSDIVMTPGGIRVHGFGSTPPVPTQSASIKGDLWRLAALLYEMLTGRQPFGRDDDARDRDNDAALVLPGQLRRGVPKSLDHAVARALSHESSERPASASAFQKLLQEAGTDLNALTLARAPLARRRRRHFGTLLPTLSAVALLILVWLLWNAMRGAVGGN
ncbi:MAG TPA: serine/threonine-protein kinase [Candidatus Eisenbacteria bacterium]